MVSKAERKKLKQAKHAAWLQSTGGEAAQPQRKRRVADSAAVVQRPPLADDLAAEAAPVAPVASAGSGKRKVQDDVSAAPKLSAPLPKRPKVVPAELGQNEVYVKSLPKGSTEESIIEFFKDTRPLGVRLGIDRQTGQFRGYAFLSFGSKQAADRCIEEWDGAWMGEQHVELSHAADKRTGSALNQTGRGGGRGAGRAAGRGGDRGGRGGRGDRGDRGGRGSARPTGNPHKADVWPGDWTCPSCGANVYGSLDVCYKPWCKEPKPEKAIETMTGEILDAPPAAEVIAANKAMQAARVPASVPCESDASNEERSARAEWLTRQISTFASQKQLAQAVAMHDSLMAENLKPTVYTFSNLINAHVNCGDLRGAHKVFKQLIDAGFSANVVVFTTLLKGHAACGEMEQAEALFDQMAQQVPSVEPDLRFITTYLRGCLRVGDARRASIVYQRMRDEWGVMPDSVAYKLLGRLLSQNLKLERLRELVEEAEQVAGFGAAAAQNAPLCMFWAKGKCDRGSNCAFWHDPSIVQLNASKVAVEQLDTKASLRLALAHAEALVGNWNEAAAAIEHAASAHRQGVAAAEGVDAGQQDGWDDDEDGSGGSLLFSHSARDELGREISRIADFIEAGQSNGAPKLGDYLGRLFIFSSRVGEDTVLDAGSAQVQVETEGKLTKEERRALKQARKRATSDTALAKPANVQTKKTVAALIVSALQRTCGLDAYTQREVAVEQAVSKVCKRCLTDDGRLKWKKVFSVDDTAGADVLDALPARKRPVKLEINSGSGEWVAAQAAAEASIARWVAMELRHDRVYDCFSRMVTGDLKNLAVVGGDASQVLRHHIADGSFAHICINFPESPQRTAAGSETTENNHLLTSDFFRILHASLADGGCITIFSHDYKYCKLLARTIASVRGEPVPGQTGGLAPQVGERLYETQTPRAFDGPVSEELGQTELIFLFASDLRQLL